MIQRSPMTGRTGHNTGVIKNEIYIQMQCR